MAKLRKKVVKAKLFWKINAFRPKIKARRGRTGKFKFGLKANWGGLVKELGFLFVTQFMSLEPSKITTQNGESRLPLQMEDFFSALHTGVPFFLCRKTKFHLISSCDLFSN